MKKFVLSANYRRFVLYGNTPEEALLNAKSIPQRDQVSEDPEAPIIRMPKIEIFRILGVEDLAEWGSGSVKPYRVIADTSEGTRFFDLFPSDAKIRRVTKGVTADLQ